MVNLKKIFDFHKFLRFRFVFLIYIPRDKWKELNNLSFCFFDLGKTRKDKIVVFPELLKIADFRFLSQDLSFNRDKFLSCLCGLNTFAQLFNVLEFFKNSKSFLGFFKYETYLILKLKSFFFNFFIFLNKKLCLLGILSKVNLDVLAMLLLNLSRNGNVVSSSTPEKIS